ncbi:hypothetical protein [Neorhizobium sp. JUb45]|uniref:hypothetical protein n=1 Tax=Neorhizobium sp. JUb45 TaxID=2485113 RepID=UPI0010532E50|nr:hypothetical protein [Neorhizobium sp. JUb45]
MTTANGRDAAPAMQAPSAISRYASLTSFTLVEIGTTIPQHSMNCIGVFEITVGILRPPPFTEFRRVPQAKRTATADRAKRSSSPAISSPDWPPKPAMLLACRAFRDYEQYTKEPLMSIFLYFAFFIPQRLEGNVWCTIEIRLVLRYSCGRMG